MSEKRYDWTQPCCDDCWEANHPGRRAVRMKTPEPEKCVHCGLTSLSGIYIRVDPREAPYPSLEKE